eukprot:TRINITY_DN3611_c0_g1_i1.p1 TRINITY_DN3611_c0_g1~~TRINITY_DN3611_c0_g1_i1.p1  ORF type:complete len:455 (-),score=72.84 TRINITY_DN3611_c0_g1_i1:395-1759(-)
MGSTASAPLDAVNVSLTIATTSPVLCCAAYTHASGFTHVMTGHEDGRLLVHLAHDGHHLRTFEGHRQEVRCCCATPDGHILISGSPDDTLRLWNLEQGCLAVVNAVKMGVVYGRPECMCVTSDGAKLMMGCHDATMRLWDLNTLPSDFSDVSVEVCEHMGPLTSCCVSSDGTASCWCSAEYPMVFHGPKTKTGYSKPERAACLEKLYGCSFCAFTPNNSHLVFGRGSKVLVYDTKAFQQEAILEAPKLVVCGDVSPDGTKIVCGGDNGALCVWSLGCSRAAIPPQQPVAPPVAPPPASAPPMEADTAAPECATPNPTPATAAEQAAQPELVLPPASAPPLEFDAPASTPTSKGIMPGAAVQKSAELTPGAAVHKAAEQEPPPCYESVNGATQQQISADGQTSTDGLILVGTTPKFAFVARMVGHTATVTCCCVTPDGRTLVSGSSDKTIRLWKL